VGFGGEREESRQAVSPTALEEEIMTAILVSWVNEVLSHNMSVSSLSLDLSNGFVIGALLHAHNQLPAYRSLRGEDSSDAKIANFCLLAPALARLGVTLDATLAHDVIRAEPKAASTLLYQIK
jgi:hypothetical protein